MPTYNCAKYIEASIRSVLEQTYTDWELLIVDDCSSDHTDQVVSLFHDERIRFFRNEKNSGAAIARNVALREAKGRWIAFLDSDDLWLPDKLERQIEFMERNGYSFSYTKYSEMDEQSNDLKRLVSGPKRITKRGMYQYCWPGCLTVMYDAQVVGLIQMQDIKKNNDYAMWLKVCKKANCYLLDEVHARYRRRSGSISDHGYMKLIKWHYRLYREAENRNPVSSFVLTVQNLFFGVLKKIRYVRG
jgi:glycosyltransferase involved in cell wall biosynthesis